MARISSKGKCNFCQAEFSKGGMSKHLAACPARPNDAAESGASGRKKSAPAKLFHISVEGRDAPMYWMHLEMPVTSTLSDLDTFLRNKWLECCGHMSAFRIGDESYVSSSGGFWGMDDDDEDTGETAMGKVKLGEVLEVGQQFTHEYDFGSTTELKLKVVGEHEGAWTKGKRVEILAENNAPEFRCDNCGELATQLCVQCFEEDAGWLCENCAEDHKCGEEMLLPVVNSPRMGVCAYGT